MSGRRSSSSEGTPAGIGGGGVRRGRGGRLKDPAGLPIRVATACSNWLRRTRPQASISYDNSKGSWRSVEVTPLEIALGGGRLLDTLARVADGAATTVGK